MKSKEVLEQEKYDKCVFDIGVLLQRTSQVFQMMEREQRRETGFTGSQSFLLTLILNQGEMSMGEIGQSMNLEKSSVTRLFYTLKRDSLLESFGTKADRRIQMVRLTERGKLTAEAIRSSQQEYYGKIISLLPAGHVREVMNSADTLLAALEKV